MDHVEFYVEDAAASATELASRYGFEVFAISGDHAAGSHWSVALRQSGITIVLTEGLSDEHPATLYAQSHGDGVANIALHTRDARAAYRTAVARGAAGVQEPVAWPGPEGFVTASIAAFGDVVHTFVQRPDGTGTTLPSLPGFVTVADGGATVLDGGRAREFAMHPTLCEIDHLAVCLDVGGLDRTVEFYESVLDFTVIFEERIVVGAQAMLSRVVQSRSGSVTLTLIQPDPTAEPGQIDDFLKEHAGPGIQHVAFRTDAIVLSVSALMARDVEFLKTPPAYYRLLVERLKLARYAVDDLKALNILVDQDHDGQLFQIFAKSVHPRRTFFFEVIERLGARTFGSGNIRALYQAVEAERIKAQDLL